MNASLGIHNKAIGYIIVRVSWHFFFLVTREAKKAESKQAKLTNRPTRPFN